MSTIDFHTIANPNISNLTPYQPGKPIEELERELGITASIKLASNENALGPSPKAIIAATHALKRAHIYPDGAYYELRKALSEFHHLPENRFIIGNGSDNIFELIIKGFLQNGLSAVISEYAFLTIPILLNGYGITINLAKSHRFGHDIKSMVHAIDKKTRVIFVVNPNNPTGSYTTKDDFLTLLNAVPPHILVVADEAYVEYISELDYPNSISYLNDFPNLVITRTFSKAYGLAGLRVGYAIASPHVIDILNRARLPFNANHIAVEAAKAALLDQDHIKRSIQLNHEGMSKMLEGLKKLKLSYLPSIANFITINVGDGLSVYHALLKKGVIVRPLHVYQMPQYIRVSIGNNIEIDRFLRTMEDIL